MLSQVEVGKGHSYNGGIGSGRVLGGGGGIVIDRVEGAVLVAKTICLKRISSFKL